MDSMPRKRKGTKFSPLIGSHLSDGKNHGRRSKKKCSSPEKNGSSDKTAPHSGTFPTDLRLRGLKRKLGCIDPSTRIGRKKSLDLDYAMGREIGNGKFGSVRLCRSRTTGEEFACKTLLKAGEETAHREVEIMQHLSGHPGVVTLKAVFEDSDRVHLVMEFCSGGRLLDRMANEGRCSEHRAANLMKELVSVIKYCHEMGVVHRDIKPENILLTTEGKLKLADFGLAVRVASGQRVSGVAGSPAYVAPEVLSGDYSEKVDLWAAGVVLHALLVGALPFQGDSLEAVFNAITEMELDFHTGMWESISELARDLIGRMLARDVSARMSAEEVLRHPWILFYTESPSKMLHTKLRIRNNRGMDVSSLVTKSSSGKQDDDCGFVDALAAAISRVRISEPKRSRVCGPIEQGGSSNILCAAF